MKTDRSAFAAAAATSRKTLLLAFAALPLLAFAAAADDTESPHNAPARLEVIDIAVGSGRELLRNDYAVVHYDGWLWDEAAPEHKGRRFDSSRERGPPLSVLYRPTRMITGWYRGIEGMRTGGRRLLVIPPALGYGNRVAFGDIPPNSTLIFDIELLDVVPAQGE